MSAEKKKRGRPRQVPRQRAPRQLPEVHARAWIEWHGLDLLGRGRVRLLELVDEHGSITAAARAMGVSYRAAWQWIAQMNAAAGQPLVQTATGGKGGGGASLTRAGRTVVQAYTLLAAGLERFSDRMTAEVREILGQLGEGDEQSP